MKKIVCALSCIIIAATSLLLFSYNTTAIENASVVNETSICDRNVELQSEYENYLIENAKHQVTKEKSFTVVGEREVVGIQLLSLKKKRIEEPSNRWDINLTDDEIDLLAKIVWTESRGESDRGQQGAVEVIFNRMIYEYEFSGTLEEVVSQKGQFCSWRLRGSAEPTEKEYKNIKKVLDGKTDIFDYDTVYFSTEARNNDVAEHIGGHYFCRYEFK